MKPAPYRAFNPVSRLHHRLRTGRTTAATKRRGRPVQPRQWGGRLERPPRRSEEGGFRRTQPKVPQQRRPRPRGTSLAAKAAGQEATPQCADTRAASAAGAAEKPRHWTTMSPPCGSLLPEDAEEAAHTIHVPRWSAAGDAVTIPPSTPSTPPSAPALQQLVRALGMRESDLRDLVFQMACMRTSPSARPSCRRTRPGCWGRREDGRQDGRQGRCARFNQPG